MRSPLYLDMTRLLPSGHRYQMICVVEEMLSKQSFGHYSIQHYIMYAVYEVILSGIRKHIWKYDPCVVDKTVV
jgi:hypothetical protein